jgi:predicted nucleic acid-binding protein
VILVDTSVWVEFLRRTERPPDLALTRLLNAGADLSVAEPVVMEVLAGVRAPQVDRLRRRLLSFPLIPTDGIEDFELAAAIYRRCREGGETVRSLIDCLIAAAAIRVDAELLHADADFDAIARHTVLRLHAL